MSCRRFYEETHPVAHRVTQHHLVGGAMSIDCLLTDYGKRFQNSKDKIEKKRKKKQNMP
jgi:hypothetical protein